MSPEKKLNKTEQRFNDIEINFSIHGINLQIRIQV